MVLADVMKEVLFLKQVWHFMLPAVGMPCIPVFEEYEGAVQLAQSPITNSYSEHIDVRHRFLRDWYGGKRYRPSTCRASFSMPVF